MASSTWIVAPARTLELVPASGASVYLVETTPNADIEKESVEIRTVDEAKTLILALAKAFDIRVAEMK